MSTSEISNEINIEDINIKIANFFVKYIDLLVINI